MTQNKMKIKKGDTVIVTTGADVNRGKTGTVLKVLPTEGRVVVSGVNIVKRHLKVSPQNPQGIVTKEASIHVSNVALLDPVSNQPTKVGFKISSDGQKVRYAKRSGQVIE